MGHAGATSPHGIGGVMCLSPGPLMPPSLMGDNRASSVHAFEKRFIPHQPCRCC